jgi:uncharacterized protein
VNLFGASKASIVLELDKVPYFRKAITMGRYLLVVTKLQQFTKIRGGFQTTASVSHITHRSQSSSIVAPRSDETVRITKTSSSSQAHYVYTQASVDATQLVDALLQSTRSLMNGSKHHMIAYSGGIDSSLATALVHQSATVDESVRAVLGLSPAVPSEQVALAEEVAQAIGVPLDQIPTTEGTDETYIENSGQACLACKTHLYTCLASIVEHAGGSSRRLYNGTNADDLNDPTRLGLIAADRFDVHSPLRYTTKEQVRIAGKHMGLPNWNHAASPCLRSRLALGVEAIPEHLRRIEQAERHVRQSLDLDATHNLRVRLLAQNRAMIEVEAESMESAQACLDAWQVYFQELGFESVNVRCFKSGSEAKVVPPTYQPEERLAAVG